MDALDRLGWADGFVVELYGRRLGVRTNHPEVLDAVRRRLPVAALRARGPTVDHLLSLRVGGQSGRIRRFHLLYADAVRLARGHDLAEALGVLERHLDGFVAVWARRRVFVDASVVGWDGSAIVLPGGRRSERAAVVDALVRAGGTRYSDTYAVVDARGRVHPYLRAPLRRAARHLQPLPVGLVAVTRHRSGSRWRAVRLSRGGAVLELLAHARSARLRPGAVLGALRRVVGGAAILKAVRGEAEEAAARLIEARGVA